MKTVLVAIAAAVAIAAPAFAQTDHSAHHPAGDQAKAADMANMTPQQMHEHCSMMMGGKMQGAQKHNHSSEKLGHGPTYTAPSEAEMKAMHEKCAAKMDEGKKNAAPAKP